MLNKNNERHLLYEFFDERANMVSNMTDDMKCKISTCKYDFNICSSINSNQSQNEGIQNSNINIINIFQ